jgi:hypothetical protein
MPQRRDVSGRLVYLTCANGAGPGKSGDQKPINRGQIRVYDAAGGSWTDITPANMVGGYGGGGCGGISIDRADPRHLVASTINTWRPQGSGWGDRIFTSADTVSPGRVRPSGLSLQEEYCPPGDLSSCSGR